MPVSFAGGLIAVVAASPGLVGRWDVTMRDAKGGYPSWFEIVQSGDSLAGRFQGRFGHATPLAGIAVTGNRFRFTWPNEDDPKAPATRFEGTLAGNRVTGRMLPSSGATESFVGTRAPALARGAPGGWGPPIDLLETGLAGWIVRDGKPSGWTVAEGVLRNQGPSADLISRRRFGDFRLHLEVRVPPKGNSGIYLRGRHEIQVQDDFGKAPGSRLMGGVYGQVTPTSLPARPAGEWQVFEVTMVGRRVTVILNGQTIIDGVDIPGITGGALDSREGEPGPLMLQGDHTAIEYRNIRIEPAIRR